MNLNQNSELPTVRETGLVIPALTMGFGTSVVMWAVGFVTHLPGVHAPTPVVGGILLAVLALGLFLSGRCGGWKLGVASGFVAGLVNLLILGSLLAVQTPGGGVQPNATLTATGWIVFATLLGGVLGFIGGKSRNTPARVDLRTWLARFAGVAAVSALPVLLSGGLVTSADAGLAVPDWPTSYGANMFLFPLSKMTGGIYYEHAHRLFGSLVGLTVLTLTICVLAREPRKWVKAVAIGAFLIVLGQGVLGGTGVTAARAHTPTTAEAAAALPAPEAVPGNYATRTDTGFSRGMRMVHGITGQLTFAYLLAMAAFLSPLWTTAPRSIAHDGALRIFTMALLLGLILQLSLGAALRHFGHIAFMHTHVTVAVIVLTIAGLCGFRASARAKEAGAKVVRVLGKAVIHTIGLQVLVGLFTLLKVLPYDGNPDPPVAIILATAHQAIGAVLLGVTTLLFVWTRRFMAR